jgi:hypothetical protein
MTPQRAFIDGIALWAPTLPGWNAARLALCGRAVPVDPPRPRPAPLLLAPAERRRASDAVALALEVASAAVAQSGRPADQLPSVFVSSQGDLAITNYMCSTLAADPSLVSPTKFHNSVHNAPAGYWTIGCGCRLASTALTAFEHSFAAGLLEAATQCAADASAVLLVGCDVDAAGPLATVTASRGLLAAALVLAPECSARSVALLEWSLCSAPGQRPAPRPRSAAARALSANALADCLPLFEALAALAPDAEPVAAGEPLRMPLAPALALQVTLSPVTASVAESSL